MCVCVLCCVCVKHLIKKYIHKILPCYLLEPGIKVINCPGLSILGFDGFFHLSGSLLYFFSVGRGWIFSSSLLDSGKQNHSTTWAICRRCNGWQGAPPPRPNYTPVSSRSSPLGTKQMSPVLPLGCQGEWWVLAPAFGNTQCLETRTSWQHTQQTGTPPTPICTQMEDTYITLKSLFDSLLILGNFELSYSLHIDVPPPECVCV